MDYKWRLSLSSSPEAKGLLNALKRRTMVKLGDSMSNQPMNKKISTSLSQINLIFGVLIGSCMRTPKNPIFLCQLRSMSNLRSLKKFALFPKYDVPRPLL